MEGPLDLTSGGVLHAVNAPDHALSYELVASAFDRLSDVLRALDEESVRYVLFGGQAVNLHGIPRFTDDIDLFIEPTPENVERLRRALTRVRNDPDIEQIRAEDLAGDYAVVRYGTPDGFAIDLVERRRGIPVRGRRERDPHGWEPSGPHRHTSHALPDEEGYLAADRPRGRGRPEGEVRPGGWLMGVQKFRTFEAARRALWLPAGDPRLLVRMKRLAELRPEAPSRGPTGVQRFRTIEEAKASRVRPSFCSAMTDI